MERYSGATSTTPVGRARFFRWLKKKDEIKFGKEILLFIIVWSFVGLKVKILNLSVSHLLACIKLNMFLS